MRLTNKPEKSTHSPSMSTRSREYGKSFEPLGEKSMVGTTSSMPLTSNGSSPCTSFLYACRRLRSLDLASALRCHNISNKQYKRLTRAWP